MLRENSLVRWRHSVFGPNGVRSKILRDDSAGRSNSLMMPEGRVENIDQFTQSSLVVKMRQPRMLSYRLQEHCRHKRQKLPKLRSRGMVLEMAQSMVSLPTPHLVWCWPGGGLNGRERLEEQYRQRRTPRDKDVNLDTSWGKKTIWATEQTPTM